ncbi:glycoside hydrolase family 18 [Dysgonomonas macrotermitis]|uniref:Putative glycoside hydrolase Family 18, chitinase_18 n=1 Tax=Dysgonomonas macrotermitis TaxID=1346286 RepID=A0A1M4VTT8_9BACT|nr:glycoside hydrolase family 18 [Dysgonomonas macrotermitis]SHE72270.1 Putative glycoside hydrolase Family 18, chitinase_18 [Dysgonomonas macrotermitis]
MEKKNLNKILIFLLSFIAGGFLLTSCSDWTEDKSVDINQPTHPAYSKYLEKLRAYKSSDHSYIYAWFDNSEKAPYSRGQHMYDIPDSVDVVILMHPASLADFEVKEMQSLKTDKGTQVAYSVSYDAIQKTYEQMVKDETEKNENYEAPAFLSYLKEKVDDLLALSSTYSYDGIIVSYKGQSTVYMTNEEKAEYTKNQEAFLSQISTWYNGNKSRFIVFEGSPQFLLDKTLLASCKHIIFNNMNETSANDLSVEVLEAMDTDVPTDRFIVAASATSLDPSDKKTGYYGDNRAIIEAAYWVTEKGNGYTKAGLGIYNIQNDYYNITNVYQYAKKSINIMNPAPIN